MNYIGKPHIEGRTATGINYIYIYEFEFSHLRRGRSRAIALSLRDRERGDRNSKLMFSLMLSCIFVHCHFY